MDESSATDAEILKAARWAEGCRRYEAIRRLIEDHKPRPPKSSVADTAWELGVSRATLYRLVDIYKSAGTVEALQPKITGRRAGNWVLPREAEEVIERAIREVYTYLTATGEVIGLSGKGCSTSSHTVKVFFSPLYGPSSTGAGDLLSVRKKPSCPVAAPRDCSFSFSTNWPAYLNGLYLTSAEAEKAYSTGASKRQVQFLAVQAATGYEYTLSFDFWTTSGQ